MFLRLSEITIDESIYPRERVDWITVYKYQEALKAGAKFPPLVVGRDVDRFVLLDGVLRYRAYENQEIEGSKVVISGVTAAEFFAEAVRRNVVHGRPLTIQERVRAIIELRGRKYADVVISRLVAIPVEKIERLVAERALPDSVVLRAPICGVGDRLRRYNKQGIEEIQDVLAAGSQAHIFTQALRILENGLVEDSEAVHEILERLTTALMNWQRERRAA